MVPDRAMTAGEGDTDIDSAMIGDHEEVWEGVTEPEELQHDALNQDARGHVETIEISSENPQTGDFDSENDKEVTDQDDDGGWCSQRHDRVPHSLAPCTRKPCLVLYISVRAHKRGLLYHPTLVIGEHTPPMTL